MKRYKIYISIIIIMILSISAFSQETVFRSEKSNISEVLPPLQTLIDSALVHNPEIKYTDETIKANEYKLQSGKSFWTRNLGVQTDIRYGTFNNISTNTSEGQSPSLIATRKNQTNYGIGLYMKFPLHDLVNRKNQIGFAKAEIEQAQAKAESIRMQIRQMVIRQYNDVILKHTLFQNKSKSIETGRINIKMIEEEFVNGITPVVEYARIHQIVSLAEDDLERSKMEFVTSYMILEEMTGLKFYITDKLYSNENN